MDELSPGRRVVASVVGVSLVVLVWQLVAGAGLFGSAVASPVDVLRVLGDGHDREMLRKGALTTGSEALRGFAWGMALAVVAGVLVVLLPPLRRGVDQLATIESAVPPVALGPVLLATFDRSSVPAAMAACTVFFTIYIAWIGGLTSVSRAHEEVFSVFGSSWQQRLLRARIPSALPTFASGIKVAMPLAIIGAVIGEWFGASNGIGPLLLTAMRGYRMPMMWAAAGAAVVIAMGLFGIAAVLERLAHRRFGPA